jgi:2'-5' RNA ligase
MLLQGGVPGARWQTREQLHLTLRFIGEVDGRDAGALDDALAGIDAPSFDLQLHGVGQFGNKQPHTLWAAARKNDLLEHLQRKVDTAIRRVGQPQSSGDKYAHKFTPHVTLARLRHPELEKVRHWLTAHALFTSNEFTVENFCLYSSKLTSDGSIYRIEQDYPLRGFHGAHPE